MTPQERQLIDDLFGRLSKLESAPRDPNAAAAIVEGLRAAPNAVYALVQTVLLQDEALKRANSRIEELESRGGGEQAQSGGFLDSMRETIFGQNQSHGSVPNVRPPEMPSRPVWNSGEVLPQSQRHDGYEQGGYNQAPYGQAPYNQTPYGQPYGAQAPMGGGGSFLGTAAAAAAGMAGGSLLLGSIRSMMGGGNRQAFGDTTGLGGGSKPWSDQSNSDLARDAGINDIGSHTARDDDNSRAGLFDTASDDNDRDDMDYDADDSGGDGGSDSV